MQVLLENSSQKLEISIIIKMIRKKIIFRWFRIIHSPKIYAENFYFLLYWIKYVLHQFFLDLRSCIFFLGKYALKTLLKKIYDIRSYIAVESITAEMLQWIMIKHVECYIKYDDKISNNLSINVSLKNICTINVFLRNICLFF